MNESSKRVFLVNCAYLVSSLILFAFALMNIFVFQIEQFANIEQSAGDIGYSPMFVITQVVFEFIAIALPGILILLFKPARPLIKDPMWKRFNPSLLLVIPFAFCVYFCVNGVTVIWMGILEAFGATQYAESVPIPKTGMDLLLGVIAISITPALCEEFLFRGVMQSAYSKLKPAFMIIIIGCSFALMHGQLLALPGHLMLGILLGLVVYFTKSIWAGVIFHAIHNAMAIGMGMISEKLLEVYELLGNTNQIENALSIESGPELLISGLTMIAIFGALAAAFLVAMRLVAKRYLPKEQTEIYAVQEPVSKLAYLPLIPAALMIIVRYVDSFIMMTGGYL